MYSAASLTQATFESNLNNSTYLFVYASTLGRTGQEARAESILDYLLAKNEISSLGGLYWQVLYERGLVAQRKGDTEGAIKYFKGSVEAIERVRSSKMVEAAKIGFAGNKQAVYQDLVSVGAKGDWTTAFEYAEHAKARAGRICFRSSLSYATGGG